MPRARRRPSYEPPIYRFRVRIRGGYYAPDDARDIWREIEVAANQTLADLGELIPLAFAFDDPHLWSFFLSGKAWDPASEYALDMSPNPFDDFGEALGMPAKPKPKAAAKTLIRDVPYPGKTGKQEFLYLFDFGDQWEFGVKLLSNAGTVEPGVAYPRIVASQGDAPPQYPLVEDEGWDEDVNEAFVPGGPRLVSLLYPPDDLIAAEWASLVTAEREQVERLREFHDDDHYAPMARHFVDDPRRTGDAVLDALLAFSRPDATWIDIGAGGGRYALPLALHNKQVIAVEPSPGMREVLTGSMREHDIENVDVRPIRWPDEVGELQAEFVLAAHVGYDVEHIEPFIDAMEDAARERCFLLLLERAPSVSFLELWSEVHNELRIPLPGWREMLHYLLARGATPDVRIFPRDMPSMTEEELRASARRRLWLKEGSRKDKKLQKLLTKALKAGQTDFQMPATVALISWPPDESI